MKPSVTIVAENQKSEKGQMTESQPARQSDGEILKNSERGGLVVS